MYLQLAAIEYRRMWNYMNSNGFEKNRPIYFPDGGSELYEGWTKDKEYTRGWRGDLWTT
jgi:hypothetical protein